MSQHRTPSALASTFAIPAAIAAASIVGLIAALLGDGAFDATSWLTLSIPLVAIAWALFRRRR